MSKYFPNHNRLHTNASRNYLNFTSIFWLWIRSLYLLTDVYFILLATLSIASYNVLFSKSTLLVWPYVTFVQCLREEQCDILLLYLPPTVHVSFITFRNKNDINKATRPTCFKTYNTMTYAYFHYHQRKKKIFSTWYQALLLQIENGHKAIVG